MSDQRGTPPGSLKESKRPEADTEEEVTHEEGHEISAEIIVQICQETFIYLFILIVWHKLGTF